MARLREPRVRRILEPMLAGTDLPADLIDDDVSYLLGLGLERIERGELQIANPIYREVIPRTLAWTKQISMHQPTEWYVRPDGALDVPKPKLDTHFGTLAIAGGEWVYPARGIAVFVGKEAANVLHVVVFQPTDLAGYRARLRLDLEKKLRPRR